MNTDMQQLSHEHAALMVQYGRAQRLCSERLAAQALEIDKLQTQLMRQRGRHVVQLTALAWEREDNAAFRAALPGLPRRVELARRVQLLLERVQNLMREKHRWLRGATAAAVTASAPSSPVAAGKTLSVSVSTRPVLWITQTAASTDAPFRQQDEATSAAASNAPPGLDRMNRMNLEISNAADEAALESSLAAADMVICQTGCLSHQAYWRVQDHCKRTGKTCVMLQDMLTT